MTTAESELCGLWELQCRNSSGSSKYQLALSIDNTAAFLSTQRVDSDGFPVRVDRLDVTQATWQLSAVEVLQMSCQRRKILICGNAICTSHDVETGMECRKMSGWRHIRCVK